MHIILYTVTTARGTRAFGHLRPHTEFLPRNSQDLASPATFPRRRRRFPRRRRRFPSVAAQPKCRWRPNPRECQILDVATSWRLPNPGDCHILENAKSWKMPHLVECQILESARSRKQPDPGCCQILGTATSWRLPHPGCCPIPDAATPWKLPHPGKRHFGGGTRQIGTKGLFRDTGFFGEHDVQNMEWHWNERELYRVADGDINA